MSRFLIDGALVMLLSAAIAACGGGESTPLPVIASMESLNRCQLEADVAGSAFVIERSFNSMQELLKAGDENSLDPRQSKMLEAFEGPVVIDETVEFDSSSLSTLFVRGETTLDSLRSSAGLREVLRFSTTMALMYSTEAANWTTQFGEPLRRECEAQEPEALEAFCDRGNESACRAFEIFPGRDLALIAEACEQVPYILACKPENPPPWDPPEAS